MHRNVLGLSLPFQAENHGIHHGNKLTKKKTDGNVSQPNNSNLLTKHFQSSSLDGRSGMNEKADREDGNIAVI